MAEVPAYGAAGQVEGAEVTGARRAAKSAAGKFVGRRKVKPKLLALVTEACSG